MKFTARMYRVGTKACDGSSIPRDVMLRYLTTQRYKDDCKYHRMIGGLTHISRNKSVSGIAPNDSMILDNNMAFYVERIYFEEDNCLCDCVLLDPSEFSGQQKDRINQLIGLLKSGCMLDISMVVAASWSPREVAEEIERIYGVDVTDSGSFPESHILKVFSQQYPSNTRIFSTQSEVKLFDEGSMAGEGIATNTYENVDLHDVCPTCLLEDTEFMKQYKELPHVDKKYLKAFADKYIAKKFFTYDVNLVDRMLITKKPIFTQVYLLIKGYGLYYKLHKSSIDADPEKFIRMLMADFSNIILKGMRKIQSGVNPAAPLGLKGYSDEIESAIVEFTNIHFRNTQIFKSAGFLPKTRFEQERDATIKLYNSVLSYITDGAIQLTNKDNIIYI